MYDVNIVSWLSSFYVVCSRFIRVDKGTKMCWYLNANMLEDEPWRVVAAKKSVQVGSSPTNSVIMPQLLPTHIEGWIILVKTADTETSVDNEVSVIIKVMELALYYRHIWYTIVFMALNITGVAPLEGGTDRYNICDRLWEKGPNMQFSLWLQICSSSGSRIF